jgi:hypothetical protein
MHPRHFWRRLAVTPQPFDSPYFDPDLHLTSSPKHSQDSMAGGQL